ncbi:DUF2294 domain-containing protein [Jeotgalibacillus campisalis]|uniref:Na+-translocating membrane potential-generating system MpsC domain-containing protein n=1 Tax=Jeotgalibacillus campisalis TaxID=220754 RepID=A0A0C2RLL4_9BACL|nr:Na-translocating system protein MpsC family protein [Jeotgalibacillus campisalis]KIL51135.1 hypothetical protein KR50_10160 [Jeotgalibacillus campisalis]
MPVGKTIQQEVSGYISTLLRDHFGKGPKSVYVTLKHPFITIHFRGFIAPMEKVLLQRNEWKRVLEIRDLLVEKLKEDVVEELQKLADLNIEEFYADWNLKHESGLFIGVMKGRAEEKDFEGPPSIDKKAFEQRVRDATEKAQKVPGRVDTYWLSERMILVKRTDILVGIEKALIKEGYSEVLKLAKRPMERSLLEAADLGETLHRNIVEIFLDWDFINDFGYVGLILEPQKDS